MLKLLENASPTVRRQILKDCTKNFMCCICECAKGVLTGAVPLTPSQKSKLDRHKNKLKRLVLKKTLVSEKQKLIQSGGFLSALIHPIAAFLQWARFLRIEIKMEPAKKLVLVEARQIEKWKETPLEKVLSRLDGRTYEILHRDIADDEKAKLYSNSLSRYLNIDKPSVLAKFESNDKSENEAEDVEILVLETIPKKWKLQASRLLKHLKNNLDVSCSKGELVLKKSTIPKTHAVDLVNDLLCKRTTVPSPTGWKELANVLKEYNVSR